MKLRDLPRHLAQPGKALRLVAYKVYTLRHPDEPWLSQGAVRFCDEHLRPDQTGLEWGSGRSTAWFGRRLGSLLSIEYQQGWQAEVQKRLDAAGLKRVECRYVPLDHDLNAPTLAQYDPIPRYVRVAEDFADGSLDFVVVDGHYRQACIVAALPKLRSGGLLLVDNTDRMPLREWGVPENWPVVHRSRNAVTETTLWRKP